MRAQRIAAASEQLLEGFADGSDKGAETEAKPEIWQNKVDFESKLHELTTQSSTLYTVAQAQSAHHDLAAHTAATQTPTQRWTTDAPLRAGMRDLREATELLNHYQMGHLDDVQRDNAVAAIDAAIKNMIANCKLKPDADTALHGLLAKFIAGADAARAGKFTKVELVPMQEALARYPQLFVDAEWEKAAH